MIQDWSRYFEGMFKACDGVCRHKKKQVTLMTHYGGIVKVVIEKKKVAYK